MERSLSILLPVQNAQATLTNNVHRLLELASELTDRFEMLIIDQESTDRTVEVAVELSVQYPQVRLVRGSNHQGVPAALQAGLQQASGDILCVHEGAGEVDLVDLRMLWHRRNDRDLVLARHDRAREGLRGMWAHRMLRLGRSSSEKVPGSGFHMLRRETVEAVRSNAAIMADEHEIRLRRDAEPDAPDQRPRRPNFISQIRRLALGE